MKLPTLWIACAFASGIALAGVAPLRLWGCVALALVGIAAGLALLRGNRLAAAWAAWNAGLGRAGRSRGANGAKFRAGNSGDATGGRRDSSI